LKHLLKLRPTLVAKPSASGVDNAQPLSPMRALALLSTLQSADIVLPTTDGHEIRLRRITEPTAEQKSLLQQLGISLPEHLLFNRKCSVDSAIRKAQIVARSTEESRVQQFRPGRIQHRDYCVQAAGAIALRRVLSHRILVRIRVTGNVHVARRVVPES
jgi:hypothetical protein